MATIVSITRIKRRPRADVVLDDGTELALSLDIILQHGLIAGRDISNAHLEELRTEDERRQATDAALQVLARGQRSERELRLRLRRRGLPADAVQAATTRMRELGYLDDAAYARTYVDARQSSTPRSRRFLLFELGQKGVNRDAAAPAIEAVSDEDAAYDAAGRRLRQLRGLDRPTFERRLGAFLTSRGFGYGVARSAIGRLWAEMQDDEDTAE